MKNFEQDIIRIWQYIDNDCTMQENAAIENLIATDEKFSVLYQEQLALHQSLQQEELEQPSMRFSKNVMEKIAELNTQTVFTKQYLNNKIIYSIGFIFIAMMALATGYAISQIDFSTGTTSQPILDNSINYLNHVENSISSFNLFNNKTFYWILLTMSAFALVLFIDKLVYRKNNVEMK